MNATYAVEEWAAGTVRGRQVFNFNYRMAGKEFRGWRLVKVVTLQEDGDSMEKAYVWQRTAGPENELLRVDITERHHWRQAQQSLHGYLLQCVRPDIPRGTRGLARLGDVNFAAREARVDVPAAVFFSRGNLFVWVGSVGRQTVDVSDFAVRLDAALSEPPAGKDMEKGKARALRPLSATVKAGEARVLIKDLRKAAPRGEWLKILVPDGELGRKDNALIYTAARGGKKEVGIFAIGEAVR